jgi:CBS-domain-containing membrane protein
MKARDVMTHCVVTIPATASVRDAIAKMVSHHVSGMPVVGPDARLAGIITEADLLHRRSFAPSVRGVGGSSCWSSPARLPTTIRARMA